MIGMSAKSHSSDSVDDETMLSDRKEEMIRLFILQNEEDELTCYFVIEPFILHLPNNPAKKEAPHHPAQVSNKVNLPLFPRTTKTNEDLNSMNVVRQTPLFSLPRTTKTNDDLNSMNVVGQTPLFSLPRTTKTNDDLNSMNVVRQTPLSLTGTAKTNRKVLEISTDKFLGTFSPEDYGQFKCSISAKENLLQQILYQTNETGEQIQALIKWNHLTRASTVELGVFAPRDTHFLKGILEVEWKRLVQNGNFQSEEDYGSNSEGQRIVIDWQRKQEDYRIKKENLNNNRRLKRKSCGEREDLKRVRTHLL
jgi:hypothetical protein